MPAYYTFPATFYFGARGKNNNNNNNNNKQQQQNDR